jgi:hypothetical protein
VREGESLLFIATPNVGYKVRDWQVNSQAVQSGGNSYTLSNIVEDATVQVTFIPERVTVTPTAGAHGSISPSSIQTIDGGGDISFTATPESGYTVDRWLVAGFSLQSGGTTFSLTNVTADVTVQVTFKPNRFTVTPSAGANGSISPNTPQSVDAGGTITFTASPNSGYVVNQWVVGGLAVQNGGNSYTLSNIQSNKAVQVTFKLAPASFTYTGPIPPQSTTIISAQTGSSVAASVQGTMTISYSSFDERYTVSLSWTLTSPSYPNDSISNSAQTSADGLPPTNLSISLPSASSSKSGAELNMNRVTDGYSGSVTLHTGWTTYYTGQPERTGVADTTHSSVNLR